MSDINPIEGFAKPNTSADTSASSQLLFAEVYTAAPGRSVSTTYGGSRSPDGSSVLEGTKLSFPSLPGFSSIDGAVFSSTLSAKGAPRPDSVKDGRDSRSEKTTVADGKKEIVRGLDSPSGMPTETSSFIKGIGNVMFTADRSATAPHKINALNVAIAGSSESLKLIRKDNQWKVEGGSKYKREAILQSLGIKADAEGRFKGELEVTKRGSIKYQDSEGPFKKTTQLSVSGQRTTTDFGNYTRTTTEKNGATSTEGWNGRRFAKLEGSPKTVKNTDGSISTTLVFKPEAGLKNIKVERTAKTDTTGNIIDKAKFTKYEPKLTGKEGQAYEYDGPIDREQ